MNGFTMSGRANGVKKASYVVYWNNIPLPYMVERFNALADRVTFEFEAWFNDRIEPDRSWEVTEKSSRFNYRYLPITRLFGRIQHWPLPLLGHRPDVPVSLYAKPVFIIGSTIVRLRAAKTVFRVLMTQDRWVPHHPARNAVKRFLFQRADAFETPGEEGKQFATHTMEILRFSIGCSQARCQRDEKRAALLVTYQALASGLPAVTTPNCISVVQDGIDGHVVPMTEAVGIAEALECHLRDPDYLFAQRRQLGRDGTGWDQT